MGFEAKRDASGRFLKGTAGGPGRPTLERERQYTETMVDVCTAEDWREICLRAVADAKAGNHRAREWLAKYLIGDAQHVSNVLHLHQTPAASSDNPYRYASDDSLIAAKVALERLKEESRRHASSRTTEAGVAFPRESGDNVYAIRAPEA